LAGGQYRAMRHGVYGILGICGNVESASCTLKKRVEEPNPTLSAKVTSQLDRYSPTNP